MLKNYYDYNRDYFEKIDSPNKAYFLGFIMGDGYIHKPHFQKALRIGIQERDIEVLNQFIKEIGGSREQIKLRKRKPPRQHIVEVVISSKKIVNDLKKNGLSLFDKTNTQKWPQIEKKYIIDLIRGLIDSDGSFVISSSLPQRKSLAFEISFNGTKNMCEEFKNNFEEHILGFQTGLNVRDGNGAVYYWRYRTENVILVKQIYNKIYPSKEEICHLKRKKDKFEEFFTLVRQNAPMQTSLSDYPKEVCVFQVIPGCTKRCGFCYNHPFIHSYQFDPKYILDKLKSRLNQVDCVLFGGGEPLGRNFNLLLEIVNSLRKERNDLKIGIQTSAFHPDSREKIKELNPDFVSFTINSGRKGDISVFNNNKGKNWETKLIYIPGKIKEFLKYKVDVVQQFIPGECLDPEYNEIPKPTRDEVMAFAKKVGAKEIITQENGRERV